MVMDPNDKQRHKPSPKHTLDEVRKSLEDMVRNEFDDVAPAAQPQHVEGDESALVPDSPTADATRHAPEPLQSLPRRKPVGIDTEQLLRSLKGLISHELAEGGGATGDTENTGTSMETEAPSPPADFMATRESPSEDAAAQEPVAAVPSNENPKGMAAPEETEDVALDTLSEDDVPEVDLSSEFESEAELLELEAMAKALAEEAEPAKPPAPLTMKVEAPNAEPETAEAVPVAAVEQQIAPPVQSSSPLPSLRVVDLPHASGPLKAFAVYDPALDGEPDMDEAPVVMEPPAQADTIREPPVFVSQWLDELSRQPSHSELGLLEQAEKPTPPSREPTAPDLEDEVTIDLPAVTAAATDMVDHIDVTSSDVVNPQHKPKARHEQASKPIARTLPWTDMDTLEIPGGEQYPADVSEATPQSVTDEGGDTGAQLALDIPGEMEELSESELPPEETSRVDEELAPAQSDEKVDLDLDSLGSIDTGTDHLQSDEKGRVENEETELIVASDRTSTRAEPTSQSPPSKQASSVLALDEQEFAKIPTIDFGGDATGKADKLRATGDESAKPTVPLDPELDLASPPAAGPGQIMTELSLADGPLLGPSRVQTVDDSATIDLGKQAPETSEEFSAPAPKEPRVPPPAAKEEAPTRPSRVERVPTTGGGIIARRRETPDGASHAREKPAVPRRDKPPREIKADKAPSPPKSRAVPLKLSDEPAPAPKLGPAVFKLSDEPPPPPKEARMPPAVKEKVGDNIIAPPPEKPAVPRRDKPPREIKADKAPSPPKSRAVPLKLSDEPAPAPKLGPAVFKLSDEPPSPKEARVPPAVKEKATAHSSTAKPLPETKRDTTAPAPKLGPAVFKPNDERPPPKEARVPPPSGNEKAPTSVGRDQKPEGLPASPHKPTTATAKPHGGTPAVKPGAPAPGKGDDIPVLEDAVASTDRPGAKPAAPLRSEPVEVPKAERQPAKDTAGSRNLAVQVVAKLNTELRKCGERALSPATVDRLQYLLREVLERGSAVVDNSRKKR